MYKVETYELKEDGSFVRVDDCVTEADDTSRFYPGDDAGEGRIIYETSFVDGVLVCMCCAKDHHKAANIPFLEVEALGADGRPIRETRLISPQAYLEGKKCRNRFREYYLGKIIKAGLATDLRKGIVGTPQTCLI